MARLFQSPKTVSFRKKRITVVWMALLFLAMFTGPSLQSWAQDNVLSTEDEAGEAGENDANAADAEPSTEEDATAGTDQTTPAAATEPPSAEAAGSDETDKDTAQVAYQFDWEKTDLKQTADAFLAQLGQSEFRLAYQDGDTLLRETRTLEQFQADVTRAKLDQIKSATWNNGVPAKDGARLTGTATLKDDSEIPIYMVLLGDSHIAPEQRNFQWDEATQWRALDAQATSSLWSRIQKGEQTTLDILIGLFSIGLLAALGFMIARYVRGLKGSPYELYLMFFTKLTEYSAYGAASYCFVIFLREDVGLGDIGATSYYTVFTLTMTVTVMVVGAVCDTIGIKKSLLIGCFMLLTARLFMPLSTNIYVVSLLGFLPFAIGTAFTGPVLKVAIKKFTTVETAALGFGLFYTLMNVGFAIGGWLFDYLREVFGDGGMTTLPVLGIEMSTYQVILGIGFLINIPDLIAILLMREGSEMTENGPRVIPPVKKDTSEIDALLQSTYTERKAAMLRETMYGAVSCTLLAGIGYGLTLAGKGPQEWVWAWVVVVFLALGASGTLIYGVLSLLGTLLPIADRLMLVVRESAQATGRLLKANFSERPFWIYLFMLAVLVFVRLTFFIFHVAFPTYGIRYFGAGAKVGGLFGVLNPVMIVFLVPLISVLTQKIRSYNMLLIGTAMSAGAVFLCFIPDSVSIMIGQTWFGELVYDRWLEVPFGQRDPFYIALILFIIVFTIGEAIWSPRLMQFSAEIAPRGREGSYIALAILPYFMGKALAGGMSGFLLTNYTPEGEFAYPDHLMFWAWIGGMAIISPIGLVVFRKLFNTVEEAARAEAKAYVAEAKDGDSSADGSDTEEVSEDAST